MLIDWFTVGAQVLNFLILVWLLKRFLYGPIVKAMDQREERIAARFQEAEEEKAQAREAKARAQGLREDMERNKEEVLDQARQDADQRRQEMLERAREEADQRAQAWREDLERRQGELSREVARTAASGVMEVATKAVADLAGEDLQESAAQALAERLGDMDGDQRDKLVQAANQAGSVTVASARELSATAKQRLTKAVHSALDKGLEVDYQVDPELVLGLDLRVPGFKLGWSLSDYLGSLESRLDQLWQEELRHQAGGTPGPDEEGETPPADDAGEQASSGDNAHGS